MPEYKLEDLQYSNETKGPFKLYIYEPNSQYHRGGVWFRKGPMKYPEEEIPFDSAVERVAGAMADGREVRICDGGDMLVFHAKGAKILYGEKFLE